MKKNNMVRSIVRGGIIAALYAVATMLLSAISYGPIQFRVSEALTVLPFFFPEAIPGLFVGCLVSNLLSPNIVVLDVIFGSLATLLAAVITGRTKNKFLAPLPPVLLNAVIIGAVVSFSMTEGATAFFAALFMNILTVGAGQLAVCYGLGLPLIILIKRYFPHIQKKTGELGEL